MTNNPPTEPRSKALFKNKPFSRLAIEVLRRTVVGSRKRSALILLAGIAFAARLFFDERSVASAVIRDVVAQAFTMVVGTIAIVLAGFTVFAGVSSSSLGKFLATTDVSDSEPGYTWADDIGLRFVDPMVPMLALLYIHLIAVAFFSPSSFICRLAWKWPVLVSASQCLVGLVVGCLGCWSLLGLGSLIANVLRTFRVMLGYSIRVEELAAGRSTEEVQKLLERPIPVPAQRNLESEPSDPDDTSKRLPGRRGNA